MLPPLTLGYIANVLSGNLVIVGYCLLGFSICGTYEYGPNDLGSQLGVQMLSALFVYMLATAFVIHIAHIVRLRSKKQMRRINALAHIAQMAHKETAGYRSIVHFISNSVREQHSRPSSPIIKNSIAGGIDASGPQPTRLGFLYLRPEAILQSLHRLSTNRRIIAIFAAMNFIDSGRILPVFSLANGANQFNFRHALSIADMLAEPAKSI